MRHLFPDETKDVAVADAVKWFEDTYYRSEEKTINNTMPFGRSALHASGLEVEVHTDPFQPRIDEGMQPCFPWWGPGSYEERVEAYLSAGWIGYVDMNFGGAERGLDGKELPDRRGHYKVGGNHMVVLDGIRTYWLEKGEGNSWSATQRTEVHIVCSVKGSYWIEVREWIEFHGGLFIWWVRARDIEYLSEVPA